MLRQSRPGFVAIVFTFLGCGGDEFESAADTGGWDGGDASLVDAREDRTAEDGQADGGQKDAQPEVDVVGKLGLGDPCDDGSACESEHCVDGVCCVEACTACAICNAPGKLGTCSFAVGENPKDACGAAGEACSGVCDEAGSCLYPEGNACLQETCDANGVDLITPRCDGTGACVDTTESCWPFACNSLAPACHASCNSGSDACATGAYCDGDACVAQLALSEPCSSAEMCSSAACVDGVCCDASCDGECESCAVPGHGGTCTPIAEGDDPDAECTGTHQMCVGACDGSGACAYPGSSAVCGDAYCHDTENSQVVPRCNGTGDCIEVAHGCGLFDCVVSMAACLTTCANHAECIDGAYCDETVCHLAKDNATPCDQSYECSSGYCEQTSNQKRCCNTLCPSPMDCVTGECLCQGVECPVGESCVPWYRDLDQDGFGDPASMIMGCENTPPKDVNSKDYVRNMDDCYDLNPSARPGQTAWFQVDRGDGSFDYDCNGMNQKEYNDTLSDAATCTDCKTFVHCWNCGFMDTFFSTYGFVCHGTLAGCGPKVWQSFKQNRPCGQTGTLYECVHGAGICTPDQVTKPNTVQRCR